jgi:hypothetical protein
MGTMHHVVRLGVGSLCLLLLLVHAATAATAPSTAVCVFAGLTADGKTSAFKVALFNPMSSTSLTYQVGVVAKGTPQLVPVQLAGFETKVLDDKVLSPSGVTAATLLIATTDLSFVSANVFSSFGGVETAVPPASCYTVGSGQ